MKRKCIIAVVILLIILVIILGIKKFKSTYIIKVIDAHSETQMLHSSQGQNDMDDIWCGIFQLAWNELKNYVGSDIEFIEETPTIVQDLNQSVFSKDMISAKDYYIKVDKSNDKVKSQISKDLKKKFKMKNLNMLDNIDFSNSNGIVIYSMLNKEFHYLRKFDDIGENVFYDKERNEIGNVKYFGMNKDSKINLKENIEFLYYKDYYNFAIKIKTKEKEDVILYKCDDINEKSLKELYGELKEYSNLYDGSNPIKEGDYLRIPYINLNCLINYDELCNKEIKNKTGEYISNAIQNFNFVLTEDGGKVSSEVVLMTDFMSCPPSTTEYYEFNSPFAIFIKESEKTMPYFGCKIMDETYLEKVE